MFTTRLYQLESMVYAMRRNKLVASGLLALGMAVLSGCSGSSKPVEVTMDMSVYSSYYSDTVELGESGMSEYSDFILAEGITLPVELTDEYWEGIVSGWSWELSYSNYRGDEVESVPNSVMLESEGIEIETESEIVVETESKESESKESESKESESGEADKGSDESESESKPESEPESETLSLEEKVNIINGQSLSLNEILNKQIILQPGQVFVITPDNGYAADVRQKEIEESLAAESAAEENKDSDGEEDETGGNDSESETTVETEETAIESVQETEQEVELPDVVEHIWVINYSETENMLLRDCVSNSWYTVKFKNLVDCFELNIDDVSTFEALTDKLGNPTVIWEGELSDEEYVSGVRNTFLGYEYEGYTLVLNILDRGNNDIGIESLVYYPETLWYGDTFGGGIRNEFSSACVEVVRDDIPEYTVGSEETTEDKIESTEGTEEMETNVDE